jgi:sulfide dehydrogenase cytochrome subunit
MRKATWQGGAALLALALAQGTGAAGARVAEALSLSCNGCHGPGGVSQGASIPTIAGLDAEFMAKVLEQYRDGTRNATIMNRIARGYRPYELRKIARYFSAQPWARAVFEHDTQLIERGRDLHTRHCAECHEDSGRYQDRDTPRLAGQQPTYLLMQIQQYLDKTLPQPSDMGEQLALLEPEDLAAISVFYGSVE